MTESEWYESGSKVKDRVREDGLEETVDKDGRERSGGGDSMRQRGQLCCDEGERS